mmetsp:Transcript_17365/g.31333  ORF Transcript_17365/g.31333 Transcript_17365/m.31333 type:complete len:208 (+) Transcript_17365:4787-5410(+)
MAASRLSQLINDGQCNTREACDAIVKSKSVETLTAHLLHKDKSIRDASLLALAAVCDLDCMSNVELCGSDSLLKAIMTLLDDPSEDVRVTAACILHSYSRRGFEAKRRLVEFGDGRLLKKLIELTNTFERLSLLNMHLTHMRDLYVVENLVHSSLAARVREAGLNRCLKLLAEELEPQTETRIKIKELGFTRFVLASIRQLRQDMEY